MTVLPPATVMAGLGYESAAKALGADRASAAPARLTDTAPAASVRAPDRAAIACQRDLMMFTGSPYSWCRRPCAGQPCPSVAAPLNSGRTRKAISLGESRGSCGKYSEFTDLS